jgi:hypothetical protein
MGFVRAQRNTRGSPARVELVLRRLGELASIPQTFRGADREARDDLAAAWLTSRGRSQRKARLTGLAEQARRAVRGEGVLR